MRSSRDYFTADAFTWAQESGFSDGQTWRNDDGIELGAAIAAEPTAERVRIEGEHLDGSIWTPEAAWRFHDGSFLFFVGDIWDVTGTDGIEGSGEVQYGLA